MRHLMLSRMLSEKSTPSLQVNVQICIATLEINMTALRKLGMDLRQDPRIQIMGIDSKDALFYHKDVLHLLNGALLHLCYETNDITKIEGN